MTGIDVKQRRQVRFCIPDTRSPYVEIDGVKFHVGERTDSDNELAAVLGHQGKEFTERDFILLLWLALEADRRDVQEFEVPCRDIAGKPGWHNDWRQVRTGIARRFHGPVRTQKRHVIWEPRATITFDDKQRCRSFVAGQAEPGPAGRDTAARLREALRRAELLTAELRELVVSVTGAGR